jgi:hypothetical protein
MTATQEEMDQAFALFEADHKGAEEAVLKQWKKQTDQPAMKKASFVVCPPWGGVWTVERHLGKKHDQASHGKGASSLSQVKPGGKAHGRAIKAKMAKLPPAQQRGIKRAMEYGLVKPEQVPTLSKNAKAKVDHALRKSKLGAEDMDSVGWPNKGSMMQKGKLMHFIRNDTIPSHVGLGKVAVGPDGSHWANDLGTLSNNVTPLYKKVEGMPPGWSKKNLPDFGD